MTPDREAYLRRQRTINREQIAEMWALVDALREAFRAIVGVKISETIVRAAITIDGGVWSVPAPGRHHDAIHLYRYGETVAGARYVASGRAGYIGAEAQGFLTSTGRFVSREEAWTIALAAGQIVRRVGGDEGRLFSENLW